MQRTKITAQRVDQYLNGHTVKTSFSKAHTANGNDQGQGDDIKAKTKAKTRTKSQSDSVPLPLLRRLDLGATPPEEAHHTAPVAQKLRSRYPPVHVNVSDWSQPMPVFEPLYKLVAFGRRAGHIARDEIEITFEPRRV